MGDPEAGRRVEDVERHVEPRDERGDLPVIGQPRDERTLGPGLLVGVEPGQRLGFVVFTEPVRVRARVDEEAPGTPDFTAVIFAACRSTAPIPSSRLMPTTPTAAS